MPLKRPGRKLFAVLFLDLLVTGVVISVVLAALLPAIQPAMFKARFIDVLLAMAGERATLIERHAHAGAWTETGNATAGEEAGSRRESSHGAYRVSTADGSVVAAGTLSGRRFVAGMRPAVADSASHWSVLWLCGMRELQDELVPSVCRAGTKSWSER